LRVVLELLLVQRLLAAGDLHLEWKALAVSPVAERGTGAPSLDDREWRAFVLEKEANSALAREAWTRYRQGLRRLAARFAGRVPPADLRRALAEDAFFCATHWKHSARIVRPALRSLLRQRPELTVYVFAAAEYWAWASAVSRPDLTAAEQMVNGAREALRTRTLDPLTRQNLERMLEAVARKW
jgi:hypothetical protein